MVIEKGRRITMNLLNCLEEVIGKGPGYVIQSFNPAAIRGTSEWDPAALVADMRRLAPQLLKDHAWTEWSTLPDGTGACSIRYGVLGGSLAHWDVPGYGHLHAHQLSHQRRTGAGSPDAAPSRMLSY